MFGLSLGHLLILAVVVLLFGAKRLPELGSALGKGMRAFKTGLSGEDDQDPKLGHSRQDSSDPRDPRDSKDPSNRA